MKYSDFRPVIQSGDVIAYTHRGLKSWYDFKVWLVRLFTQSEYTHVAVAWRVGERVFLLEAVGTGVRIFPLSLDTPFFHLSGRGLSEAQLVTALSHIGQPYSYLECAKAFYGRNNAKDHEWECAEYVCHVLGLECQATPPAVVQDMLVRGSSLVWVEG